MGVLDEVSMVMLKHISQVAQAHATWSNVPAPVHIVWHAMQDNTQMRASYPEPAYFCTLDSPILDRYIRVTTLLMRYPCPYDSGVSDLDTFPGALDDAVRLLFDGRRLSFLA